MKTQKTIIITFAILLLLYGVYKIVYATIMYCISKITFKIELDHIYLKTLKISDLIKTGQMKIGISSHLDIHNPTMFSVKAKDVFIKVYYEGKLIAESKYPKSYKLLKNKNFSIYHDLYMYVNDKSAKLAIDLSRGKDSMISYVINFNVFGVDGDYMSSYKIEW